MKTRKMTALILLIAVSMVLAEYVPFTVKLNVLERLVIGSLLPKETNFTVWKIVNDLKNEIAPTEAEMKAINIRPNPDGEGIIAEWDAVSEKEIVFGEVAEKLIVDALVKLDKENKLLPEHITLYQKFVIRDD